MVTEARASYRAAGAIPNPTVSYSHSEAFPVNHLLVEQPLDWLLRRGADRAASRALVASASADSARVARELDREVRLSYWRARAAMLRHDLASAGSRQADSLATIAGARYRSGAISQLELEQAQQEAARARLTESSAREALSVAMADLAEAVGSPGGAVPLDSLDTGLHELPPDTGVIETPALRSAVADSVAAAAAWHGVDLGRVPLPSLQAGSEWGDPSQPGSLLVIGLAIPIPLWNQGGGEVAAARARATQAAAKASEARLEAQRTIRVARSHLEESAWRAQLGRDSILPAARGIGAKALVAYRVGETGILPAIEALRNEREVAAAVVDDELAFQEALADWLALGGGE
jgi:cobalt-zinc-cadmium efflux system outer membrane protein